MSGIILTILKIIGIILLVVIACILLVAVAILFYPVNYKVNAETNSEETTASVYISWLFQIFRFRLLYNSKEKLVYDLKILFFQILPEKEKADKKRKKGNDKKKEKKVSKNVNEKQKAEENDTKEETTRKAEQQENKHKKDEQQENKQQKDSAPKTDDIEKAVENDKSFSKKISNLVETIKKKITNLKFTFRKICDKIKEIFSGYEKFREFILSEETKETLKFLNTQRKYLFRHIKPNKSDIYLHFGTEDPSTTGEILAVLSLVYAFYPWNLNVVPDFEESCFEGKIEIKGKLQSYVFLILLWRLYGNKNIKKIIKTVTQ